MEILPGALARPHTPRPVARYEQVQHRLNAAEVTALLIACDEGIAIDELALRFGIHRSTVLAHLKRAAGSQLGRQGEVHGLVEQPPVPGHRG